MANYTERKTDRVRIIVLAVCLVLILALVATAIAVALGGDDAIGELPEKNALTESYEALAGQDLGYNYVTEYLKDYGFAGFNTQKLQQVETYFKMYYPKELPKTHEMATDTAAYFLDYFYENTDLDSSEALTDSLIHCLVAATGDTWAAYRTADEYEDYVGDLSGTFVGIGVEIQYVYENKLDPNEIPELLVIAVYDGAGASTAGIKPGDYLMKVDGKTKEELGVNGFVNAIRGELNTNVVITVERDGEAIDFTITRTQINEQSVKYSIDSDKIGYISISSFKENTPTQFKEALTFMKNNGAVGIVFDLRNNPGGLLDSVVEVISCLVPEGTRVVSYQYNFRPEEVITSSGGKLIDLPMTVLCNEYTASAGEIFTAALRDYTKMGLLNARVIGKTTYGKGVMQTSVPLTDKFGKKDGSALTLTVSLYNPPSNVNYDGIGVTPDFTVENGNTDAQLERAYEELEKLILAGSKDTLI